MMNNRQGGEALINFISSRFKNGGMVAKFQDGGDVDDDYGTFGAEELGASVEDTAASEDIGAISGDTGDVEDIDEDLGTFPEDAITADPPPDDTGDDTGDDSDEIDYSKYTTDELKNARAEILKSKEKPGPSLGSIVDTRGLQAELDRRAGRAPDRPVDVIEVATQVEPIDFLASGMGDPSRDFDRTTGFAAPQVDADDMAGIGAVAPRSAVQAPPAGGIAGAINYTDEELADQQAADAAMSMAAPPAGGIGDLGPVTPDELDEAEDIRGRQAALVDDLDTADDLGPFGEEEILSGVRDLQNKKAGLAGLGALAGSPITAAAPFARDMFKTLTQPDVKAGELLAGKGLGRDQTAQEVVNEKGERIGVVVSDPSGVVSVQPTSIEAAFDPALRDAYSKLNERNSKEREESGSGDNQELATLDDPEVEEAAGPQKPPTIDIIPFRPQDFYYFTPGNYAYNRGLPSMMNMREG